MLNSRAAPPSVEEVTKHRFAPDGGFRVDTARGHRILRGSAATSMHAEIVSAHLQQGASVPYLDGPVRRVGRRLAAPTRGDVVLTAAELVFTPVEEKPGVRAAVTRLTLDRIRSLVWDPENASLRILTELEELAFDGVGARPLLYALSLVLDGPAAGSASPLFHGRAGSSAAALSPATLLVTAKRVRALVTMRDQDQLLEIAFADLLALRTPRTDQLALVARDREIFVDRPPPGLHELILRKVSQLTTEATANAPVPAGTDYAVTVLAELLRGEVRPVRILVLPGRVVVDALTGDGGPAGALLSAERSSLVMHLEQDVLDLGEGPSTLRIRGPAAEPLAKCLETTKRSGDSMVPVARKVDRPADPSGEQRECFRANAPPGALAGIREEFVGAGNLGIAVGGVNSVPPGAAGASPFEKVPLIDLSPGGCRVLHVRPLETGTRVLLRLQLEESAYNMRAHVAWTLRINRGYLIGFAFDALPLLAVSPLQRTWVAYQRGRVVGGGGRGDAGG